MLSKATFAVSVVIFNLLMSASTALAAGDPTKIGKNLEDIVTPNVKSFWKIGLLVGGAPPTGCSARAWRTASVTIYSSSTTSCARRRASTPSS
jgi:hypothetical protein